MTLSEGLVLGLLKQGVKKYLAIFGHGSTDIGEVLRVYHEAGFIQTFNFRNEIAMAHAATKSALAIRRNTGIGHINRTRGNAGSCGVARKQFKRSWTVSYLW
ncbi:MAG: hypothetical protein CM1200mP30_13600 [Pseudomonadota bacterium]|nr:MAG: hypothetical protein CM1200mP30_13600 [Pseudomonadota bacterium]